jgi:hypothetical protein
MMVKFKTIRGGRVFDFSQEDVIHYILSMRVADVAAFVARLKKELAERV